MIKVSGVPGQLVPPLLNVGVTVTVPDIGAVPALVAVNDILSVFPERARPMAALVFVQAYVVVPLAWLVVKVPERASLWHNVISSMTFICPPGVMVIVNVFAGPVQSTSPLLYKGVTVMF